MPRQEFTTPTADDVKRIDDATKRIETIVQDIKNLDIQNLEKLILMLR